MPPSVSETNKLQTDEPEIDNATESLQSQIEELTEALQERGSSSREADVNESMDQILLPELQGFEILKEGAYVIDPEKTISNMVEVVKKMEAQLHSALGLNTDMEKDLDDSKEMIIDLRSEKSDLENTIKRMYEEIPSKRELQMEIEYLVDERNSAQRKIKDMKELLKKKNEKLGQHQKDLSDLEGDKKDYRVESEYLAKKLNTILDENRSNMAEIKKLNQSKLSDLERIKTLEQELKKLDEKRYLIYKELAK